MVDPPSDEAFERDPVDVGGPGPRRRRLQIALTLTVVVAIVLATIQGAGSVPIASPFQDNDMPAGAPAKAPRLVFVDAAGALTTMDQVGGSVVGHGVPGVAFEFPAWSPDGTRFAAIGRGADRTGVYVFAARAADEAPIDPIIVYESADRPPFYLYWTPDSQRVTFLASEAAGLTLQIAPADGSTPAATLRAGAPMYWDFVDSGRLLVHSGADGPDSFVGEITTAGAASDASSGAPGAYRAPASSSGGLHRAYVEDGDGATGDLVVEPRAGVGAIRVRIHGPAAFTFNAPGDQLAFVAADRSDQGSLPLPVGPLRLLDVASGEMRTLLGGRVVGFFWSPNGKALVALQIEGLDDRVTEATSLGEGGFTLAALRDDTTEAAAGVTLRATFVNAVTGSLVSERRVRISSLFVNQVLPYFDQYALSHRFWSPDLTAIVLPIVGDRDVTQLVLIPADGSEARALAVGEMASWSP